MRWFGPAVVAVLSACYPVSNVCDQSLQPIGGPDGGAMPCLSSGDCPVQREEQVCTHDGLPTHACVSCEQGTCTRHVPVACQ